MTGWRTWRTAMGEALYGAAGFYRGQSVPARHFRTAAHTSEAWARALATLARRVDHALGEPSGFAVVDVGAGGGELLGGLAAGAPERWRLVGVDVADRPAALPARVDWTAAVPAGIEGLVLAVEWLDVVPVDVAELTAEGPRLVEVSTSGAERHGSPVEADDHDWLDRWWPLHEGGERGEIGRHRDLAWAGLVARLARGLAVAVDYAAVPARDRFGTLTGYRDGRQVPPRPDGATDITAHVLMESCVEATVADEVALLSQREALHWLGVSGTRPRYDEFPDAAAYVRALATATAAAELTAPGGLGDFRWLLAARGLSLRHLGSVDA